MPASAYALVATFAVISLVAGVAAVRVLGPWRWWSPSLPAAASFGALYLVGHRWVLSVGREVTLWGWEVALPFDVAVAMTVALAVAAVQRGLVWLLEPKERRSGRDGLA